MCSSHACLLPQTRDENVMATYYAHPGDYDVPWDPDLDFIVSDNFFKDFSTNVKCGNQFEIVGRCAPGSLLDVGVSCGGG